MSDEELDRDWKPSGRRPQSTIARSFSAELMDIFRIENAVTDLDQQVDERKHNVNHQNQELTSLEARIKEMEERLKARQGGNSRPSLNQVADAGKAAPSNNDASAQQTNKDETAEQQKARSRPGTARAAQTAPSSGNMPPTPGGSEDGDHQ